MKTPEELAEEWSKTPRTNQDVEEYQLSWDLVCDWEKESFLAGYQAAAPQWISVKDRLPEDNTNVLVTDGLNVFRSKVWEKFFDMGPVTHWMPLPEQPEE